MSTVLPSGSSAQADGLRAPEPSPPDRAPGDVQQHDQQPGGMDDGTAGRQLVGTGTTPAAGRPGSSAPRLDRWRRPVRAPLAVIRRAVGKAWQDRILGLSAEASFWQILSVPPLLIGLLGSLGYLGDWIGTASVREIEDRLLSASAEVLTPGVVDSLVRPTLTDILGAGRLDVVSLGFVLSLWAGSSATATFINTIVIAYGQRDVRGAVRTRLMALWLFVVGLILAVLTLPLLVLGREVLVSLLPNDLQDTATVLVDAVYLPLVLIGLMLALASFYHVSLPRPIPWHRHLPGAVFAVAFFVAAASVLRTYVADILTTALPYGALAAPIAALLFCFFLGLAILLGAEINAAIEERWPAQRQRRDRHRLRRRAATIELEARKLGLR